MFKDYTLQTSWGRALVALACGALVGAVGVTALYLPGQWAVWKRGNAEIIEFWTAAYVYNLYYVSITLVLAGIPIWFVAHRLGFRTRASALLIAFVLSLSIVIFMALVVIADGISFTSHIKSMGNWVFAYPFILIPLASLATAFTIWRIAYRRPADNV